MYVCMHACIMYYYNNYYAFLLLLLLLLLLCIIIIIIIIIVIIIIMYYVLLLLLLLCIIVNKFIHYLPLKCNINMSIFQPEPDGTLSPDDIPPPQIIREMQPNAKFIITLCDPIKRMYSDYNFLGDDLKPVKHGPSSSKSPQQFHERAMQEVSFFSSFYH